MKKILLILILTEQLHACMCLGEILMAYQKIENHIKKYTGEQAKLIEQLAQETDNTTKQINQQTQEIKKIINLKKENILMKKEILFYLKQKTKLID